MSCRSRLSLCSSQIVHYLWTVWSTSTAISQDFLFKRLHLMVQGFFQSCNSLSQIKWIFAKALVFMIMSSISWEIEIVTNKTIFGGYTLNWFTSGCSVLKAASLKCCIKQWGQWILISLSYFRVTLERDLFTASKYNTVSIVSRKKL